MEIVWKFIIEHWYVVLWLVLEVVFGVLLLLKKSKSNEPLHSVVSSLPKFIIYAENKFGAGHGDEKKKMVLSSAIELFRKITGISVTDDSFVYKFVSEKIEEILKTPMKKEDK